MSEEPKRINYNLAKAEADKVDEQIIAALQNGNSFRVEAGAGSGKTYSLNKVIEWIQENKWAEYRRKKQTVICITYTNAAVDVLAERLSNAETLEAGAMNGAILENYVVSEIAKTYLNSGKEPFMYYYRDKDAKEIDIVLEHDGILNPLEIKKTANPGSELTKVFSLLDKASTPRGKGAILCMKPALGAIDKENYIIPIWMI